MGAGPDRLVDAGAVEELTNAGHDVDVVRIGRRNGEQNEIGASFEVVRRVAEAVAEATGRGAFPLVLSGNCMSSIGVVAGLGRDVDPEGRIPNTAAKLMARIAAAAQAKLEVAGK
jgi:arginase